MRVKRWGRLCALVAWALLQAASAAAEPAIWLVQSPTAKVYLFGTMHILPKKADWLGPKIAAAFSDSQELWEEADIGQMQKASVPRIMDEATAPDGDLWAKLPQASADKFRAELKNCHLPPSVVATFRPWFATMIPTICALTSESKGTAIGSNTGPETVFLAMAKADGKKLRFFETIDEQIGYLSGAPESVQLRQLREAIDQAGADKDDFAGMEAQWAAGDVDKLAAQVKDMQKDDPAFYATIFTQRNQRFAAKIATLLQGNGTAFVAIGAGHLAGPDSVQAQLATRNIQARRL